MGGIGSGRDLRKAKRYRVECQNMWCQWKCDRLAPTGPCKPCPKCGGPVLPYMRKPGDRPPTRRDAVQVSFKLAPEFADELRKLGHGSVGEAAAQIVRGVLSMRRLQRLAEVHK